MGRWRPPGPACTRSTSRSPEERTVSDRLIPVVLFFEILLVVAAVVITWFAVYTVYRLITDDS